MNTSILLYSITTDTILESAAINLINKLRFNKSIVINTNKFLLTITRDYDNNDSKVIVNDTFKLSLMIHNDDHIELHNSIDYESLKFFVLCHICNI